METTKKPGNNKMIAIYAVLMTVAVVVLTVLCVRFYRQKETKQDKLSALSQIGASKGVTPTSVQPEELQDAAVVRQIVRDYMENNKGTLNMLRELFPEDVIVFHGGKYLFIPVIEGLAKNDIDNANLEKLENGEIVYKEGKKTISHKGIDVSKYQGEIDWKKVADSGIEYAFIRVGFRGYGTGAMVEDQYAEKNIAGALDAGIKVGVYFFSQAVTKEEAIEEADFTIKMIKKYRITYPVVYDTETTLSSTERTKDLSVEERTEYAVAFCERVREAGYTPVVYANLKWFTMSLDLSKLEDYDKWFAGYNNEIYFPYKISIWQYSENGKVDGIEGNVDMNISFKEWDETKKEGQVE